MVVRNILASAPMLQVQSCQLLWQKTAHHSMVSAEKAVLKVAFSARGANMHAKGAKEVGTQ